MIAFDGFKVLIRKFDLQNLHCKLVSVNYKKTETNTCVIYKDERNIIHVLIKDGAVIDYYDALDQYLVIKNLSDNKPVLKLIDGRCKWLVEKKGRQFFAGKEVKEKTIARAILVNSTIRKVLLNFFNDLNKPEVPAKVFNDYDEAYRWLLEMGKREKNHEV